MASKVRVVIDSGGMKALLNDAGVTADLESRMGPALAAAKANAPVQSGAYRDSLRLMVDHTDRSRVRLASTVSYAMDIEAGTGNLARALDQAGGA